MANKSIYTDSYRALTVLLREIREGVGMTQEELARALGEDQSFVSKIERRERRVDIEEVRRICKVLNVPFMDFAAKWEAAIQLADTGGSQGLIQDAPQADSGWSAYDLEKVT